MAFRTVVIKNRCKLEYSLNYLIYRGEEEKKILIDEIEILIIQNTSVSLTAALLSELAEKKVKVIFCDTKNNPQFEMVSYTNNYCSYKKIMNQVNIPTELKNMVWQKIIHRKIYTESKLLKKIGNSAYIKLDGYLDEIEEGDSTNREGHAAKVYFNALFGEEFSRRDSNNNINKYLNYGYSILISAINRELKIFGMLLEVGIHHIGETNPFNFSYDLIEPLRSYIDSFVVLKKINDENFKNEFQKILTNLVICDGKSMYLDNAIHVYVRSVVNVLTNGNIEELKFIDYEL